VTDGAQADAGGLTPERWRQAKRVFAGALERAPGERQAYVAEACAADPALCREVESLLASAEGASGFLATPAAVLGGAPQGQPSVLAAGHLIGRYRVLGLLGAGGMGQVYLAEDPRLGRKVALKLLPRALSTDPDRLRRFEQEARAASALSHPNVCVVHEIGETDDGRPYIAMEHVPGESLREVLERHRRAGTRVSMGQALDIARQIAGGLEAAHAAGVVHRDVKPENVMVRPDGLVKVLDFGLAKLAAPEAPASGHASRGRSVHTEPGTVLGTVQYMSPEQARGLPVDARTDVWSLGVVLYELLAGRPPFEGETPSDIMVAVLDREPAPLVGLTPNVPDEVRAIAARALIKDRERRSQSTAGIGRELSVVWRRVDAAGESGAPGPGDAAPARAPGRGVGGRVRRWPLVGALVLTAIGAAGVWAAAARGRVPSPATVAPPPVDQKYVVAVLPFESVSADTEQGLLRRRGDGGDHGTPLPALGAARAQPRRSRAVPQCLGPAAAHGQGTRRGERRRGERSRVRATGR
jgi:serine/threonine-protein kinase